MRKAMVGTGAVAAMVLAAPVAQAVTHNYSALLQQSQEVPAPVPVAGAGGMAAVTYDDVSNLLSWNVQWWNLSGNAIAAHFHGPAGPGATAGPQVDIGGLSGLASPSAGSTTISSGQGTQLLGGEWYINVHTALNGSGEIRGQLGVAGSSQTTPFLPGQGDGQRGWRFDNVTGNGAWFDPIAASGYSFQVDAPAEFLSVMLPNIVPDNNSTFIVNEVGGSFPVAPGGTHNFTQPVSSFTITDIDPTVDGDNPVAFPVFLAFNEQTVSFTMTPIPEPASLGAALLGAALLARRRQR